ncbi:heme-binding protein [Pseudoroseomonas wenyumeiae]
MPSAHLTLDHSDAQGMIRAAQTAASAFGVPYCVAVVGAGGHLLAFAHQDGTSIGCGALAIGKARTARLFDKPTEAISRMARGCYGPLGW